MTRRRERRVRAAHSGSAGRPSGAPAATSCWNWSGWSDSRGDLRTNCPEDSSSVWPWRARWPTGPTSCCSTSRSGRSTRRSAPACGARSATIQRKLGIATIFVTHDQEEAFELADRVGVMNFGRILEVGRPTELYLRPQTEFVATFLGRANLMIGEWDGSAVVRLGQVRHSARRPGPVDGGAASGAGPVPARGRGGQGFPGGARLAAAGQGHRAPRSTFSGSVETLRLRLPALAGTRCIAPEPPFGADYILVDAMRSQHQARRFPLSPGSIAWVGRTKDPRPAPFGAQSPAGRGGERRRGGAPRRDRTGPATARAMGRVWLRRGPACTSRDALLRPGGPWPALAQADRNSGVHPVCGRPSSARAPARGRRAEADAGLRQRRRARQGRCVLRREAGPSSRHVGHDLGVRPLRCSVEKLEQGERFLEAGARTLSLFGVETRPVMRRGDVVAEILAETERGGHDLVVLGAAQIGSQVRLSDMLRASAPRALDRDGSGGPATDLSSVRGRTVDDHEAAVGFV